MLVFPANSGPHRQISGRGKAAVDVEDMSGDKARFLVIQQEQRGA